MRDEIDQIIEILAIITLSGYIGSATALKYPSLIYPYTSLAIFMIILFVLDVIYHVFSRRLYPLREKVSSPVIISILVLLFIGYVSLNPNIYLNLSIQATPIKSVSKLEIELLPHITILLFMTTLLFISNTVENHYHKKLSKRVREVMT